MNISASAYYASARIKNPPQKRGPKPAISDDDLAPIIRAQIDALPFHSVGYKKLHVYWRKSNPAAPPAAKERFYAVMAGQNWLQKQAGGTGSRRPHVGVIKTQKPDDMWATDAKKFFTEQEGWCNFMGVIDHFNSEIISWSAIESGDRFASMEPVLTAIAARFGKMEKDIAAKVSLRTDCGSSYRSKYFRTTALFYGLKMSYTRARSPESNGVIERFHRTLQEQVFDMHQFASLAEAEPVIRAFIDNYNRSWIFHESKGQNPLEMRENYAKSLLPKCA